MSETTNPNRQPTKVELAYMHFLNVYHEFRVELEMHVGMNPDKVANEWCRAVVESYDEYIKEMKNEISKEEAQKR